MANLADRYRLNSKLVVPELKATFEITGNLTPLLRGKNGAIQKVGYLKSKRHLYIDYKDHTIRLDSYDAKTNKYSYSIHKQAVQDV